MEEILKEILLKLNKLDSLENRFDNFEKRFDNFENRFDNLENRFDNSENRFDNLENRFNTIENQLVNITEQQTETNSRLTRLETTVENKTNTKIQALFEDRQILHTKLDEIQEDVKDVKTKVTNQDIKIQVIDNRTKAI